MRPASQRVLPFLVALALAVVVLRLLLFDYPTYFALRYIPNHDMYQGASFFATSMQSMRLTGDIAWWNPAFSTGYAQYYQALLSPLAPTIGHIVFIVWAQLVFALDLVGVAIPEYFQYLTLTFIVFPFLATLAFAWLCSLLFRSRSAVALGVIVFGFSTIGLWNSAWYYFQEPATLLFLLGALIHFLQRPAMRSVLLLLAAGLIQLASMNYWTIFYSWFVLIFLGTYAVVYRLQVRRAGRRLVALIRRWPFGSAGVASATLIVAALWIALVGSAVKSEGPLYERSAGEFTVQDALGTIRPAFFLTRSFHPDLEAVAPRPHDTFRNMHHSVYLGAFLLPLLLAVPFYRWRRVDRWLLLAAAGLLVVCFAPRPLVWVWEHVPPMNKLRHLFMFYPGLFRLMLALLACASLDRILSFRPRVSPRIALAALALFVVGILLLAGRAFGPLARLGDTPAALLLLVPAVLVSAAMIRPAPAPRAMLAAGLLLVALADLSTYFRLACSLDSDFTATRWGVPRPFPPQVAQALRRPWAPILPESPGLHFYNMPIPNDFWVANSYMPHRYVGELPEGTFTQWDDRFAAFHLPGDTDWMSRPAQEVLVALPHKWRHLDYNSSSVVVEVPDTGWLSIAQLHDPAWQATLDGRGVETVRANFVRTAIPVQRGTHELLMSYWPRSRRLYWPASFALEGGLLLFGVAGFRAGRGRWQAPA